MNIFPGAAAALGTGYGGVQMSMIGFRAVTAPSLTARSGWFRLMLADLQQRSLDEDKRKKDEQEQGQAAPSRESEAAPAKPVATPKPATRKPRRQRTPEPVTHEARPFRVKPFYNSPSVPELIARLPAIQYYGSYTRAALQHQKVVSLEVERKKRRQRNRRRAAAFLLLAA